MRLARFSFWEELLPLTLGVLKEERRRLHLAKDQRQSKVLVHIQAYFSKFSYSDLQRNTTEGQLFPTIMLGSGAKHKIFQKTTFVIAINSFCCSQFFRSLLFHAMQFCFNCNLKVCKLAAASGRVSSAEMQNLLQPYSMLSRTILLAAMWNFVLDFRFYFPVGRTLERQYPRRRWQIYGRYRTARWPLVRGKMTGQF